MDEYIQIFKKVIRDSRYKRRLLVEELKRRIDEKIRKRLIEAECPLKSINQQYKKVARLDRNYREKKQKKRIEKN